MSTAVDICNLALSNLGDEANVAAIDPPDGSVQASHCARYYPIVRDAVLALGWSFNLRRGMLAQHDEAPEFGWQYAYPLPADALSVLSVHSAGSSNDNDPREFVTETASDGTVVVMTNEADALVRYTVRITDTQKFPPLVVVSMGWLLASYLAGPIIKGESGRKAAKDSMAEYLLWIGKAGVADARQVRIRPEHMPEWVAARDFNAQSASDAWGR